MVRLFDTGDLRSMRSLLALAVRAVASCLRGMVGRAPGEVQELLVQLGVPGVLHGEIKRDL